MIDVRVALTALGLIMLPGSCIAAPAKAPEKLAAPIKAPAAPKPMAPPSIGRFQLDRLPQQGSLARGKLPIGTKRLVVNGQDVQIAADGRFIIGFGRDYDATAVMVAYLADGTNISERVAVAPPTVPL